MDEQQRTKLADMLRFYREMGIEEFYVKRSRLSNLTVGAERQTTENNAPVRRVPVRNNPDTPTEPQRSEFGKKPVSPLNVTPSPVYAAPTSGPVAQSMSLFESPSPSSVGRENETLEQIREDLGDCHRCRLASGRKTIVFGQGDPHAELVFIGEGPGADEDAQGLPFVGRAGKLLNRMIQLIGMKREEVYICNVVKCRPPGNRTPFPDEIGMCSPFLLRQVRAIKPRLVCCLGAPAVRTVLGVKEGITKIRGRFYDFQGTRALATVHPAYILRNPREEKILREDFQKIAEYLKASR